MNFRASVLVLLLGAAGLAGAATLTRAEIIKRFRAAPVTMCSGLIQVWAHCPADMRRKYQTDIAGRAAQACRALNRANSLQEVRLEKPGLVVYLGDGTNLDTRVITRVAEREDGSRFLKVWLPAPGFANDRDFLIASVRGWSLAIKGKDLDDEAAWNQIVDAIPEARIAAEVNDLVAWRTEGVYTRGRDDEDYLKLRRRILRPGFATREEVLTFAARLILYPAYADCRFRGRYDQLEFRDAVHLAKDDLLVRIAALKKADELPIWGGGRGETLATAADLYSKFLRAFARGDTSITDLDRMLDEADEKLKEALP